MRICCWAEMVLWAAALRQTTSHYWGAVDALVRLFLSAEQCEAERGGGWGLGWQPASCRSAGTGPSSRSTSPGPDRPSRVTWCRQWSRKPRNGPESLVRSSSPVMDLTPPLDRGMAPCHLLFFNKCEWKGTCTHESDARCACIHACFSATCCCTLRDVRLGSYTCWAVWI